MKRSGLLISIVMVASLLISCTSPTPEIIENEKNGLLIPVEDEKALKEAMEKLFHDKGLYNKLKANSSKSVKKYCIENIAKDWINLFEEMHSS